MSLINVSGLTFYYDGNYDNIFEDVSFQIDTDWKLGFIGRNGKGKTTFLNLLLGKYEYKGSISSSVDFDYFPFQITNRDKNTIDADHFIGFNLRGESQLRFETYKQLEDGLMERLEKHYEV